MKYILLGLIKMYWSLKPKNKLPKCIFRKSCSHFVYEVTKSKGFFGGLKALVYRFKNCRYGFELLKKPITDNVIMILPNGDEISEDKIAKWLLK
ncbi:hypothetical protein WH52_00320 [Tenacibaculum holothuriorum]|uniref:Membrane protein insertion efficiency factor YidD n=2 Tax=Tenacibaculum holothuriorum TaxID=1635173 RepID=A0A1Y2PIL4_9FLAO|nr:hypothetical protein WH52_00320 [Tenacibaculum holothuriorum]